MTAEWIDVSIPLRAGMVHWPGDPEVSIERVLDMERGGPCNVSSISIGSHTGTHMDPPFHYVRDGASLDAMPLDATVGPARVIEIRDPVSVRREELANHELASGERVLFKTRNSSRCWETDDFLEDFVYISLEGARYLADRGVRAVGIDYLSVGGFHADGEAIHRALLEAGIWIVEGLNLARVQPGIYELVCLPIKIQNSDGAPARAMLRPVT
ncbi:MAG: cyclase family protein [Chloroflexi bacterium]|nr:cyclase family protein [Chloroflexota bacterium]